MQLNHPLPDAEAYRGKMRDALGDRDPMRVLAATADAFAELIRGASAALLQTRPAAGQWSACEILGHMLDVEWANGYRMRATLCDDRPLVIGYDQDRWVEAQRHNEEPAGELLAGFRALREVNLGFWRRLRPEQLERHAMHSERGPESLAMKLWMSAGHDLVHLAQLRRHLDAARGIVSA